MIKNTLYTVQRCRLKDDVFYGPIHGSHDGEITVCGQEINYLWHIIDNVFEGRITCKKCISLLDKQEKIEYHFVDTLPKVEIKMKGV